MRPSSAAARTHAQRPADPVEVLKAIAQSRALRYRLGEFDLHEAVDGAWAASIKLGMDADRGQGIIAAAFEPARGDLKDVPNSGPIFATEEPDFPDENDEGWSSTFPAACRAADAEQANKQQRLRPQWRLGVSVSTLRAAKYLIRQNNAARLETWLCEHSRHERAAIADFLLAKNKNRARTP